MPPVFAHGRLRLYLLKLLDEAPRHGYEVIRLLEERFHGLYAPSAGTVYPRLAKLEAEGLVTHATEGGRKVYSLTDAGREELARRRAELVGLEQEIRESVSGLAAEIRDEVRGAVGGLRGGLRAAATATADGPDRERTEREEWREVTHAWQEQARQAREDAQHARHQAKEAQEKARRELQRLAREVQDQVEEHVARGAWPTGVREGLTGLTDRLGTLAKQQMSWTAGGQEEPGTPAGPEPRRTPSAPEPSAAPAGSSAPSAPKGPSAPSAPETSSASKASSVSKAPSVSEAPAEPFAPEPGTAEASGSPSSGDPFRDLERLLDRFRDDIRDAARDHGVTESQLADARRHLSTASAHIVAALLTGGGRKG